MPDNFVAKIIGVSNIVSRAVNCQEFKQVCFGFLYKQWFFSNTMSDNFVKNNGSSNIDFGNVVNPLVLATLSSETL